jgi:hypothetical protein
MSKGMPWAFGPFELLKHAEEHLKDGKDFDRRIAFISYDNAIETSITIFLKLHPDQRGGRTFIRADVDKWLVNYYKKLQFLQAYVSQVGKPLLVPLTDIVYYHNIRNELYHEGKTLIPSDLDIQGIREVALWVFSTLFEVDAENMLLQNVPPPAPTQGQPAPSSETAFLDEFIKLRHDLNTLLHVMGVADPQSEAQMDIGKAWNLLVTQSGDFPEQYEETIEKAEAASDAIVRGDQVQSEEDLHTLSQGLRQFSKSVKSHLEEFRQRIVDEAIQSTIKAASPQGDHRAGIILQTVGSGLSTTVLSYVARLLESNLSAIVTSDRQLVNDQLYSLLVSQGDPLSSQVIRAESREHLKELLGISSARVILATAQMITGQIITGQQIFSDRSDIVTVVYNITSSGYVQR